MCIKTLVGHVMCLKRLKSVPFERSEPFHLLRMMGVSVPSLHIESTDSMILHTCYIPSMGGRPSDNDTPCNDILFHIGNYIHIPMHCTVLLY